MDLYTRQTIHRRWLVAADGDLRIVEEALARADKRASQAGKRLSSSLVMQEIEAIKTQGKIPIAA